MKRKIEIKHIAVLIILLMFFWLIGISNYLFSSASFVLEDGIRVQVGDYDGILMTVLISAIVISLWSACFFSGYLDKIISRCANGLTSCFLFIRENPKKILTHIGIIAAAALLAVLAEIIISRLVHFSSFTLFARVMRTYFYMSVCLAVYFIAVFRGRPEAMFVSISLLVGSVYLATQPLMWFAWDNGVHYAWIVEDTFIRTVSASYADWMLSGSPEFHPFLIYEEHIGLQGALRGEYNATMFSFEKGSDTLAVITVDRTQIYPKLAHIPQAFVTFIGRSLALPPVIVIKLGPAVNHIIYTCLVYFAMKKLTGGKYILAAVAMIPTLFVLSTTYGTDHWITGFLMLGFAYFFAEAQNPERKLELKNTIPMIAAFVIGVAPKAVYAPIMLILYFIKKDKFTSPKGRMYYNIAVTCLILFVLASFAVPFITVGGTEADNPDWRGGEGVDAAAQSMFILQQPLAYAGILLRFLNKYFSVFSRNYVTYFAHLGYSSFFFLVWIAIGFVTITDRDKKTSLSSTPYYKTIIILLTFATVSLFSTSMFVGFTEVGQTTIAGVQPRYKLPLLFPFLYCVGGFKIQNNMNKTAYSVVVFAIMSFVLLTGAWEMFVLKT